MGELACTNGSSTNSVKPPVRSWMPRITRRWPTQCAGVSTCPYIIVALVRMPSSCAVVMTSIQAEAGSLPLVRTPHVVVEDLGRGAGQRADAGLPRPHQPLAHAQPGPGRAVDHLHRRERVHVQARAAALHLRGDV